MKIRSCTALCLLLSVFFAGCKGFWDPPPSGCTGSGCSSSGASGVFYVLNEGSTGQIVADKVSTSGLSNIGSTSLAGVSAIAVAPGAGFAYAATTGFIYLYTVSSSGTLAIANSGQAIDQPVGTPAAMLVTGSWLVEAYLLSTGVVEIDAIPISTSTGLSTTSSSNPVQTQTFNINNATVYQMVLSPDGNNLFLALGAGGSLVVPFASGNTNPIATSANSTTIGLQNSSGGGSVSIAVDPNSAPRLFYIGETSTNSTSNPGGLRVFDYTSLGTGTPRSAPKQVGSTIATGGTAPHAILPLANGQYVYVANWVEGNNTGNITWYSVDSSGGSYSLSTTAGGQVSTGIQPMGLAEENTSTYVLAVSSGGSFDLEAYTIASTGALTSYKSASTGTDPVNAAAIAALP